MRVSRRHFLTQLTTTTSLLLLSACGRAMNAQPSVAMPATAPVPTAANPYRNLFAEQGYTSAAINDKLQQAWHSLFVANDDNRRVLYPAGQNQYGPLAYVKDIGNDDIRSEGMSYGMMIAVQLDQQAVFDAIWNWAKTYMYHQSGVWQGYFSWHNREDGSVIDNNPASDGEEWFVMALFFAAGRWGNRQERFNYQAEANAILNTMLHKEQMQPSYVTNMFNHQQHQVVFVPMGADATFTNPSYHLPAFYELWAQWAQGYQNRDDDRQFWQTAAQTSRAFFQKTCHPLTGLSPDYANFDGTPKAVGGHEAFRFDAFRTISNIALDQAWFGRNPSATQLCDRLQAFFANTPGYVNQYTLDGQPLSRDRSPGLIAMNAVASLVASDPARAASFVKALWDLPIPTGRWRYYDGLLYTLALLYVSGNFRIYAPMVA